jgi:uncharacterized protein
LNTGLKTEAPISFQNGQLEPFSLLVKPASADCNLDCTYCFYKGKYKLYPEEKSRRMSTTTLEVLIKSYMATNQPQYAFSWQGGEPLLMGHDFFKRVTDFQIKFGRSGASVANAVQTNAILISDQLAQHFRQYKFLLGVSLDGPAELHDKYRCYSNGVGSHSQVMSGLDTLRRYGVKTNVLTLVNSLNARHPSQIYQYLINIGVFFHQYIPCVEFDNAGLLQPYALSPKLWGEFLCGIFDLWYPNDVGKISVRYFDSLLIYLATGKYNICHMGRNCNNYLLVEHNGDIYPCDFFVEPQLKIGNICEDSWKDVVLKNEYQHFSRSKSNWIEECDNCNYLSVCSADCLKFRLRGGSNAFQKSLLCKGYKQFFRHALPKLEKLAKNVK